MEPPAAPTIPAASPVSPPSEEAVMEVRGNRRLHLSHDYLLVEVRGAGRRWVPARAIHLLDIRAVYAYEARDWRSLAVALPVWIILASLLALGAYIFRWPPFMAEGLIAILLVVLGGVAAFRIVTVPQTLMRVEAYSGPLVFPNVDGNRFFRRLQARLSPQPEGAPPTTLSEAQGESIVSDSSSVPSNDAVDAP